MSRTVVSHPQARALQLNKRHWISQIAIAGSISAIAIGARLIDPSFTIAEAAIVTWLTFYLTALSLWMAISFGIELYSLTCLALLWCWVMQALAHG